MYPPVLAFTVVVSLASVLLFGSITALKQALHIDAPKTFAARGSSASRERSATRNTLVVVQVALALVLVVSAALMIRTFQALRDVEPGFTDAATIQTARIWIPNAVFYPDIERYTGMQREILDKIAALPGVASAGFTSPASDGRVDQLLTDSGRGADAAAGRAGAAVQNQVRLARVLRSDGHANDCRA